MSFFCSRNTNGKSNTDFQRRRLSVSETKGDGTSKETNFPKTTLKKSSKEGSSSQLSLELKAGLDLNDRRSIKEGNCVSDNDKNWSGNEKNEVQKRGQGMPRRRLSVSGMISSRAEDMFENKAQEISVNSQDPDQSWASQGLGFVCKKGLKPESPNQDDFFIYKVDNWGLYGVFDGHGPFGHDVSNYVQRELPQLIVKEKNWKSNPDEALKSSFLKVHQNLQSYAIQSNKLDCTLSGTTATVLLHRPSEKKIVVAHVGDSRCVLGRWTRSGRQLEAIDLTTDHKPNSEDEKKRIVAAGGQVRQLEGDIPHRVFLKGKLYPGLAMSRAIGDTLSYHAGVIADPDVSTHILDSERDAFVLICSDGVWEFISSQEAVDMVAEGGISCVQESAEKLAREAWRRWIEEEGNVVDDITIQIIYLQES